MTSKRQELLIFEEKGPIWVGTIRANSVLSASNVSEFGAEVLAFVSERQGVNLLLNFEHVDYLSSAVLTELLRVNKAIQDSSGNLRLCAVAPIIREVFEITNLDQIFVIHSDDVETDLARFKRSLAIAEREKAWDPPAT